MFGIGMRYVLLVIALALGGCAALGPKTWSYDEKAEVDQGAKVHKTVMAWSGTYPGGNWSQYVTAVGSKVAAASDRPSLKWTFTVLDSPKPDAFATQGGYVYISRGMLALLRSENDLAAILAHEIAHISGRDTPHKETLGTVAGLGTLVAAVAYAPVALLVPQLTFAPAAAGMAAVSREVELEADRRGAEYLRRAGYPPESMSSVMPIVANIERFQRDEWKSHGRSPGWTHRVFADHPDPGKREARLAHTDPATRPDDPEFLARLDGLEFGATKREGIPYGGKRYFPSWDILIDLPEGWTASGDSRGIWISRGDRKGWMSLTSVGTGTSEDLCDALASHAEGYSIGELQRVSEGRVHSCKGLASKTTRSVFGRRDERYRIGMVAPIDTPGARFLYREYGHGHSEDDPAFLSIARSIESLGDVADPPKPPVIRIRKVQEGETFATLAKSVRVTSKPEAALRLLNQRYPSGELVPGQLVKVIE